MARILVIDDEPDLREEVAAALGEAGYAVDTACDGEEGLAKIRALRPDLVICDIIMPGMDGYQLLAAVRERHPECDAMPIVFLSSLADRLTRIAGRRLGVDDYLTKPVDLEILLATVEARLREVKRIEAHDAAERERLCQAFLTIVPHELRTPLNAIIGFSDLMLQEMLGPMGNERYREFLRTIQASGQQLLDAINDLLDLALARQDRLQIAEERVPVGELIETVLALVARRAEEAGLTLRREGPEELPPLRGDWRLLRQGLLHLVSNAIKFTPAPGSVTIAAGRLGGGARAGGAGGLFIEVRDTGIGIAAADLAHILAPFDQADSAPARRFQGIGVGLPLAQAFTELHQGRLSIDSRPGGGTTVRMTFPTARVLALAEGG